ncbi:MAG: GNAT family N-acetyltransferase [Oscillospiraceae bacterium]|nr:GNAT family N-acetyltransferase [Oscillospiraceae bacterium]
MEITLGKESEFGDIVDFGNYVFYNIDFPTFLPKLYTDPRMARHHYLIKEEGRIKAAVGSYPLNLRVMGEGLKVKGIGMVSVHRYSRGKGYMTACMGRAMDDMRAEGVDLAVLGGNRQRYEYFGFTPGGMKVTGTLRGNNVAHLPFDLYGGYTYRKVESGDSGDIKAFTAMNNAQPCASVRREDEFFAIASSWSSRLYAVIKDAGAVIGYLIASNDSKQVHEVALSDPSLINGVVAGFFKSAGCAELTVTFPPFQTEEISRFDLICNDCCKIEHSCNVNVLNYGKVILAFMRLKQLMCGGLMDGVFRLRVEGRGAYEIGVSGGEAYVADSAGPYDREMGHLEATRFLFAPSSFLINAGNPVVRDWFPLPLCFHRMDNV